MEETRENRLAELRAKKLEAEELTKIDNELGKELNELENDVLVQ